MRNQGTVTTSTVVKWNCKFVTRSIVGKLDGEGLVGPREKDDWDLAEQVRGEILWKSGRGHD